MEITKEAINAKREIAEIIESALLHSDFEIDHDYSTKSCDTIFYLSKEKIHHGFFISVNHLKCTIDCPCNKKGDKNVI